MESSGLKRFKLSEKLFMDLLDPDQKELCPYISQHLNGADFLNLSEVSQKFNLVVAESDRAMDVIQLVISEGWDREFTMDVVEGSLRRYKHLKVKSLLRTRDQVANFIKESSSSLESIESNFDIELNGVKLPLVKSLSLNISSPLSFVQHGLLSSATNLVKLQLSAVNPFINDITDCLKMNLKLQELEFDTDATAQILSIMDRDLAAVLNIKILKLNLSNLSAELSTNLMALLGHQIDCLEELKLLNCDISSVTKSFGVLKKLRRLTFSSQKIQYDCRNTLIRPNSNIEELNMINPTLPIARSLVSSSPNLKNLYIGILNLEIFEYVVKSAKKLQNFRYAFLVDSGASLEQLKKAYENKFATYSATKFEISQI